MERTTTVIIGAGQTGLAMSRELAARGVDHLILERGKIANSWRRERWDSLRLLTPNWMNGLPGAAYDGSDPEGYMTASAFAGRLERYAAANAAPVRDETTVLGVQASGAGYRVQTDQGAIGCGTLVLATGAAARAHRPAFARDLPAGIAQITPLDYKRPGDLPPGRVLVVGASASGSQIARELQRAGRDVTLAVGAHVRVPRRYRSTDVLAWLDIIGRWNDRFDAVEDLDRQRALPSLQLTGLAGDNPLGLNELQEIGVEIVGRMAGVRDGIALFSGSLANHCASADLKQNRFLAEIDAWVRENGLDPLLPAPDRPAATRIPHAPRLTIDLAREGFGAVVWATGTGPDHAWLNLPVFDRKGRIRHHGGVVADGLYVMGLPFLRSRKSTFIDGAGDDARDLAAHLATRLDQRRAA